MRPDFHPRLINGPFEDPGLFVPFLFQKRAILFDLGDVRALAARDLLKLTHVFVTHTHMDHFIGFDQMLRLMLGREKELHIYGPARFLENVEGKLAGYTWNLVENSETRFVLHATEIHARRTITRSYACQERFSAARPAAENRFDGILVQEPALKISAVILDHRLPCLGLRLEERFHINIRREKLMQLGLDTGPWLSAFKQALYAGTNPNDPFEVVCGKDHSVRRQFAIGELAEAIAMITPGQKIAYVADVGYQPANVEKIIELAQGADHLFIEAAFLDQHRLVAQQKHHLTARQAGILARMAQVKQFTLFHHSPRYIGQGHLLEAEARSAFEEA
jgi:ribonuclease Z